MNLQYLQDKDGNTTSVLVPIEEWNSIINKIDELQEENLDEFEIPEWHKKILDERLEDYRKNPNNNMNFEETLLKIRKKYSL